MSTTRRGFLGAILAAGVAPMFVQSGVLMPSRAVIMPEPTALLKLWGDGVHDDWAALQQRLMTPDSMVRLESKGIYRVTRALVVAAGTTLTSDGCARLNLESDAKWVLTLKGHTRLEHLHINVPNANHKWGLGISAS